MVHAQHPNGIVIRLHNQAVAQVLAALITHLVVLGIIVKLADLGDFVASEVCIDLGALLDEVLASVLAPDLPALNVVHIVAVENVDHPLGICHLQVLFSVKTH